jgi:hypothetical protein
MLLASGLAVIFGLTRLRGGLWGYLTARVEGRTAVALERERNRATARALELVPPGCELLEYERQGRLRVVRKSAGGGPAAAGQELTGPGR